MNLVLEPAEPEDASFLEELFYELRAPEFAVLGLPPPALRQLLDLQYRAQKQGYATQFPHAEDAVAWIDGERVGRLLVARSNVEIHVVDITVLARHRGKGIGGTLLASMREEARQAAKTLTLSVRAGNPAEGLYRRLGFVRTGGDGMNFTMELQA